MIHPDDEGFTYASDADFDREGAREGGRENPDRAWILSDRDVWYRNPFYQGPPVRHPEDDGDDVPDFYSGAGFLPDDAGPGFPF